MLTTFETSFTEGLNPEVLCGDVGAMPASTAHVGGVHFAYDDLPASEAEGLRRIAEGIRALGTDINSRILRLGSELDLAKTLLGHGRFGAWVRSEFCWSERTAERYIRAFKTFGRENDTVSDLEPSAIYALSAKSTPPSVRRTIMSSVQAGQRPDLQSIRTQVAAARAEQARARNIATVQRCPHEPAPLTHAMRSARSMRVATFILESLPNPSRLAELLEGADPHALLQHLRTGAARSKMPSGREYFTDNTN